MASSQVMNILLMGETGNGKSTLINSFCNYMKYETFYQALNGPELCPVPVKFEVGDDECESVTVEAGRSDVNECLESAQSATMATKSYLIPPVNGVQTRLIDSSGFAATQGPEQDAESVKDILNYIGQYGTLNAIGIVVKGNHSRVTTQFQYCIGQVLANLDKSAINNLVFIFTNCSRPGDTMVTMRTCLKNISESSPAAPQIVIDKSNTFCFENQVFRDLMAAKHGVYMTDIDKKQANFNWKTASKELERLLDYVYNLTPHDVTATLSINDARLFAKDVSLIVDEILSNIEDKKAQLEVKRSEIENANYSINNFDMASLTSIILDDILFIKTDQPRTVCTSEKCAERFRLPNGATKLHFNHICCEGCTVRFLSWMFCDAFRFSFTCRHCQCPYSKHEQIYYKTVKSTVRVANKDEEAKLAKAKSVKERKQLSVNAIERHLRQLELEKEFIQQAIAKLSAFIKNHAILPCNSATGQYNKLRNEMQRMWSRDQSVVEGLKSALDEQLTLSGPSPPVTLSEIQEIKKRLLLLDIYGPKIKSVCQLTEESRKAINREVNVPWSWSHKRQRHRPNLSRNRNSYTNQNKARYNVD